MKFLLATVLLLMTFAAVSQRQYFVLVESENNQPFYVRIGDNNYSSSSIGHIILSGLSDSAYTLEIGFPKDQFPTNQFVVRIKKKDHGFQLKNLPDKGWVLFDYQTMELLYPIKRQDGLSQTGYSMIKRNDAFAKLLSQVVNDTAVLYMIVYDKPSQPPTVTPAKTTVDSMVVKKDDNPKPEAKLSETAIAIPAILKLGEKDTDSGRLVTYKDNNDSVRIFISSESVQEKQTQTKEAGNSSPNNLAIITPVVQSNNKPSNSSTEPETKEKPGNDIQDKKPDAATSIKLKDTVASTSTAKEAGV